MGKLLTAVRHPGARLETERALRAEKTGNTPRFEFKQDAATLLTLEFLPPLLADCREYVLWTTCSGVEGDLSEEWSEPFSTMFSPSWLCGVGERERLRRTGEQAGVLLFELLAVLEDDKRRRQRERERWRGERSKSELILTN